MLILSSNLKYKREIPQKSHMSQRRLPLNAKFPLQLFSSGVNQSLLKYLQGQEVHYQLKQFINSFINLLNNVLDKCYCHAIACLPSCPYPAVFPRELE